MRIPRNSPGSRSGASSPRFFAAVRTFSASPDRWTSALVAPRTNLSLASSPIRIVEPVSLEGPVPEATWVDCGNPHLVLFGEDLAVEEWGPRLSCDPRFPSGINVEFVQVGASSLQTRVWERGVGETAACGSGACAVARVAVERGFATWPVRVELPGGVLTISPCEGGDGLWLQGSVRAVADGPL